MIENILNFAIRNRYMVVFLTAIIAAFGLFSLKKLPIDAVPDITNNQVQINTLYPGFSPTEIEKQITFPIENALAGIPGLQTTRSISRNGFSQVTTIFDENVNVYFARQQINERLSEAKEVLPAGADPKMGPISTGLGEIYMWTVEYTHPNGIGAKIKNGSPGWQSNGTYLTPEGSLLTNDLELTSYLRTVQDWMIRPQLQGVKGLAGVDSIGGFVRQYHVQTNPEKLSSYHLTFQDLVDAIEKQNVSIGAGYIEHNQQSYVVKADGRVKTPDEIAQIVITTRDNHPIRVQDIGKVSIGKEMRTGSATENGHEVVIGTAMMLIGANSRTVSQAVDDKIKEINHTLPPDIQAKTILNRTKLVDATIKTVSTNLIEGAILVIAILFAMLGNFRAAFISALVIPLAMLMTILGMIETKISGNLMSLGALDFGLIVDGAIIIVENCLRKLSEKQKQVGRILFLSERLEEVTSAAKEMIRPSVFGQLIIILVYLPLLTFGDVEGKMFEPMALTVIFALVAAFLLSLTFVPAAVAMLVTGKVQEKETAIVHKAQQWYSSSLSKALHNPAAIISVSVVLFLGSLVVFSQMGQEFVPTLDEKDMAMHAVRIPSTSLTQSTKMQLEVEKTLKNFPEVDYAFSKTGTAEMASDPMPPNVSDTFIFLKPNDQWPNPRISKNELIEKFEKELTKLPGNNYEFTQPIEMRFNELIAGVRSDVAVKIYGDNFAVMQKTANDVAKVLRTIKGTADVKVDQTDGLPLLEMDIDLLAASRLGFKTKDILDVISIAIGGGKAGVLLEGDRRFDIIVQLPESLRQNPLALGQIPLQLPSGGYIPLKEVVKLNMTEGLNEISRENGKRMIMVQANVRGNDIGTFVNQAKEKIKKQVKIPPGNWIDWGGQFQNLIAAREHLAIVVPFCFAMILGLLYSALGKMRYALLVFSGVPMALTGGILAIWLRDIPFSISAAVGFIALSGIAVLNGLVMVTYINQLRQRGMQLENAIHQGAVTRLRPVLMTALVASLGFVPMALATGTGAEVQKPLATVVIGGLITATLLTLYVLPALCKLFMAPVVHATGELEQSS